MGILARNEFPEYFTAYREWSASFRDLANELKPMPKISMIAPKSAVRRYEVRIAGLGGHGVKLAGTVLSEAAGIQEGLWATHRGEYGSATRGGPSMVDVVFGSERVSYPGADNPDLLVVLSQQASDLYSRRVKKGGHLIADPEQIENMPEGALPVPIVRMAREHVGQPIAAGVVALGCVAALSGVVSLESLRESVVKKVPVRFQQKNLAALEAGYEATRAAFAEKDGS
jgi:2-oxoglutarate ferredoxin oxidoreductase subunit gamma